MSDDAMALDLYRKKRDFKLTPEPAGARPRKPSKRLSFVVQKHAASHLHYDFRLELDGVLLSWAVPKGPSVSPDDKRLAMHVEDHPLEYGEFEGTIPAKQYGAGTVLLWDRGTWTPRGDPATDYQKGKLKFTLHGEKLRGAWALFRTRGSRYKTDNAWLLIKEDDEFARRDVRITEDEPDSVASARNLEEIGADSDRVWQSNKSVSHNMKAAKRKKAAPQAGDAISGAVRAANPDFVPPELATLESAIPQGTEWVHEMKYDGYRMLCRISGGKVKMFSRNRNDWTAKFPTVARSLARLNVDEAWIDGEVIVTDEEGRSSFQALQNALSLEDSSALQFYAFDLPYLNGVDLRGAPLLDRKKALEAVLNGCPANIHYSAHVAGMGDEFLGKACELRLEGVVSKRADSPYVGKRTRDWIKTKCTRRQEMVIAGYTNPEGSRTGFGALLIGVYEGKQLKYSGRVGTGFNDATLKALYPRLKGLQTKAPAFANPPRGYEAKGVHWIKPTLVAEVAFTEWTNDGTLRHPSFQGLRSDKEPTDVVREKPMSAAGRKPVKARGSATQADANVVAGIRLSNPDKVLYPEGKITKRDLARYYGTVGKWILPHVKDRPLTLVRCPNGWNGKCFYQKHADPKVDKAVARVVVDPADKHPYMMANTVPALVALLQMGSLELHPWGATKRKLGFADRLIFDFDPDDGIEWAGIVEAVKLIKTLLDGIGLRGFLKTTGGKGLHVVVPVKPTRDWKTAKAFSKSVAELLVTAFPDRFTTAISKASRRGKIFIDYLRNGEGATAIAPYSTRARKNAPVAVPISWSELRVDVRFEYFNMQNVPARLAKGLDPWKDFFKVKQAITDAMLKRVAGKRSIGS